MNCEVTEETLDYFGGEPKIFVARDPSLFKRIKHADVLYLPDGFLYFNLYVFI